VCGGSGEVLEGADAPLSAESGRLLEAGLADVRAGRVVRVDGEPCTMACDGNERLACWFDAGDPMADLERGVEAVWRSGRGPALRASMEAEVAMEKAWEAKRRGR
jgi:hypothetical protein